MQSIFSETGRIDVLVNNAAYPLTGAFEDLAIYEIKAQYETNVFGLIRTNSSSSSNYEKTEIWNHCKYQFKCGNNGWFSWRIRLC